MGSVSMNYLTNLLGPNAPSQRLHRRLRGRSGADRADRLDLPPHSRPRPRNRLRRTRSPPRLAVLDYADVDQRRKARAHPPRQCRASPASGGPTDVVVETSIVRGMPVQASALAREPAPAAAPAYVEPDPPVPQQRPSLREAERQAAGEPVARPVNTRHAAGAVRSEPLRTEPARPAPPPPQPVRNPPARMATSASPPASEPAGSRRPAPRFRHYPGGHPAGASGKPRLAHGPAAPAARPPRPS